MTEFDRIANSALELQTQKQRPKTSSLFCRRRVRGDCAVHDLESQSQKYRSKDHRRFAGAECDAIVLSTTVTRPSAFAVDAHRLNVALTRAKSNLVVVGCAAALQVCIFWGGRGWMGEPGMGGGGRGGINTELNYLLDIRESAPTSPPQPAPLFARERREKKKNSK